MLRLDLTGEKNPVVLLHTQRANRVFTRWKLAIKLETDTASRVDVEATALRRTSALLAR